MKQNNKLSMHSKKTHRIEVDEKLNPLSSLSLSVQEAKLTHKVSNVFTVPVLVYNKSGASI